MDLRRIDLNLLLVLDVLMRERNVSRAAERMFVTQSAMSHSLNRLRDVFDDPLLVRTSSGMQPTARAFALIGPVRQALDDISRTIEPTASFDPGSSQHGFVIAATDYIECLLVPVLMERIHKLAPGVDITFIQPDEPLAEQLLEEGNIDLALGFHEAIAPSPRLRQEVLFDDELICLVRKNHRKVKQRLTLKQYLVLEHLLISPAGTAIGLVDEWLAEQGLKRRVALVVPHYLTIPSILRNTDYVIALPTRLARQFVSLAPLRMIAGPFKLPRYDTVMVWHPLRDKDPAHCWIRDQITASCLRL